MTHDHCDGRHINPLFPHSEEDPPAKQIRYILANPSRTSAVTEVNGTKGAYSVGPLRIAKEWKTFSGAEKARKKICGWAGCGNARRMEIVELGA